MCPDPGGGGIIPLAFGVEGTEIGVTGGWLEGAAKWAPWGSGTSDVVVMTDPASEHADPRLANEGRGPDGNDGVREWRISSLLPRDIGCTSGTPPREENVLTWTVRSLLCVAMYSFNGSHATP